MNNNIFFNIKKIITIVIVFISINPLFAQKVDKNFIDGELYVKIKNDYRKGFDFKSKTPDIDLKEVPFLQNVKNKQNFRIKSSFYFSKSENLRRTLRISIDDFENIDELIKELNNLEEVEYVEKVPLNRTSFTPNDLGLNSTNGQWGLHKIQAQNAWDVTKGSSNIVVAVVDDAIKTNHPDLVGKFVAGRDVSDNDSDPNPYSNLYHGTHVAGIVGASTNNGTGVASIGYDVSIMPIKATPDTGTPGYVYDGYEGITWASENGAHIINMSWGGYVYTTTEQNTINNAAALGVVLIASAGNDNSTNVMYPAGYDNVISVAATDINDNRWYSEFDKASNYGSWIDVSAPGHHIKSTVISGGYGIWTGTSMASPMVAGLCGLILSVNPALSPTEVEDCILSTADQLSNSNLGAGRINAYKAVQCAGVPTTPPDLYITQQTVSNPNPSVGESITISCTQNVSNATVATLDPNPHVRFYLSDDTILDDSDIDLGYEFSTIGSSITSESESRNPTVDSSWGIGTKYILIKADANDDYTESDETNNFASIQINIQDIVVLPDLFIGARSVSNTNPSVGESIKLACFQKVANASVSALSPNPDVKYYLSNNTTYSSNDILLGSDASVLGTADPDKYEFMNITVPSSWGTGTKYILFRADANNEHQESNENNNVKYVEIDIKGNTCPRPATTDLAFGYACNGTGLTLKTTNTYAGQNRKFRYRERGTSTWIETNASTGNIAVTDLKICTLYNIQLKVQCDNGVWSAYSPTKNAWTRAEKPLASNIDAETFCSGTSVRLYCFSHSGDKIIFRYKTLNGGWSGWIEPVGSDHFANISGLTGNTQYQYQVKVKCGTTGIYSCAQNGSFTTPVANNCKIVESSNNLNVYPNPAKDLININLDINEKVETIKVYNLQGRLVKEWNTEGIEGTSFQLNLSELNKGMYMLRINEAHLKKISKL